MGMTHEKLQTLFDEWNEAGCDNSDLESFVFSLENKSQYLETELFMMYGFMAAWTLAKEASAEAIKETYGYEWIKCPYQLLRDTIMNAEVKE